MPTEAELAAIAAALSIVLEKPVAVEPAPVLSPWALAARREAVGLAAGIAERAALPEPLAP